MALADKMDRVASFTLRLFDPASLTPQASFHSLNFFPPLPTTRPLCILLLLIKFSLVLSLPSKLHPFYLFQLKHPFLKKGFLASLSRTGGCGAAGLSSVTPVVTGPVYSPLCLFCSPKHNVGPIVQQVFVE